MPIKPSAAVGWVKIASRVAVYGRPAEHGGLDDGHHFARFGAKYREAKNPIIGPDQSLREPTRLREGAGAQHERHRMFGQSIRYALRLRSDSVMPTWASSGSMNKQ